MTPSEFRRIALALPQAIEAAHMGHPDFRIGKRIFASLGWPDDAWGMVKLTPDQQRSLVRSQPGIFRPVKGTWGLRGSTNVDLAGADEPSVQHALFLAWQNLAPGMAPVAPARRQTKPAGQRKRRKPA
jgi:hypothetical protein